MKSKIHTQKKGTAALIGLAAWATPAVAFASSGEASHGPDWFVLAGSAFNFALLIALFFKFGKPKLDLHLKGRKEEVEAQMTKAEQLHAEAQSQIASIQAKMANIDAEIEQIKVDYREMGEKERAKIIAAAETDAKRIREDAVLSGKNESVQAERQVEQEVLELALKGAEDKLAQQINAPKQAEIVDLYIDRLLAMPLSAGNIANSVSL